MTNKEGQPPFESADPKPDNLYDMTGTRGKEYLNQVLADEKLAARRRHPTGRDNEVSKIPEPSTDPPNPDDDSLKN